MLFNFIKKECLENISISKKKNVNIITVKKYNYASLFMTSLPYNSYIDKRICAVGFSSIVLLNNLNSILVCPTIALVKNKEVQYNKNGLIKVIPVYGMLKTKDILVQINRMKNKTLKIICTYDSFYKLLSLILKYDFKIVVDESNLMLKYAKMKAASKRTDISVILQVWNICKLNRQRVAFISATPIPIQYLPLWVSLLDQYIFLWLNTINKKIMVKKYFQPVKFLNRYIILPLLRLGFFQLNDNAKILNIIVYLNSIQTIKSCIEKNNLSIDDVGIICGTNVKNVKLLLPYKFLKDPRNLPKYVFVTSAGIAGIDLYSLKHLSIVCSTTNKDFMMLDVTDLRQAMSRNRVKTNPFYGRALYIYNSTMFLMTLKELLEQLLKEHLYILTSILIYDKEQELKFKKNIFRTLTTHPFINLYTNAIGDLLLINLNLFNADKYFIKLIRNIFLKGYNLKALLNKDLSMYVVDIKADSAPLYLHYAELFLYMLLHNISLWNSFFTNLKYKYMLNKMYKLKNIIYKSLAAALDNYKRLEEKTVILKSTSLMFLLYIKENNISLTIYGILLKKILQNIQLLNGLTHKIKIALIKDVIKKTTIVVLNKILNAYRILIA